MSRLTRKQHLNRQLTWEKKGPLSVVPVEKPESPADDADALKSGGLVLIIGGEKNSWPEFRKHKQIVFWSGDRPEIERHFRNHDNFPKGTELVITSCFLSHQHIPRVHSEATRKGLRVLKSLSDARISHLLRTMTQRVPEPFLQKMGRVPEDETRNGAMTEAFKVAFQTDDVGSLTVIEEAKLKPAPRGELKKFVWEQLEVDAVVSDEAVRLRRLFEAQGFTATAPSITRTIYEIRHELGLRRRSSTTLQSVADVVVEPIVETIVEPTEADLETIEMPTPLVTAPPIKPQVAEQSFTDRLDSCVRLCDDALTQIQLVRAEALALKDQSHEIERVRAALRSALGL